MKAALILIDMQRDYLAAFGLEPAAGQVVERAAMLLGTCRRAGEAVVHVWTTVHRAPDDRMPHWVAAGKWMCEAGTAGHEPPEQLAPAVGEAVVEKRFFGGFAGGALEKRLRDAGCDTVILAGVHLHACVRATALEAYERGLAVWIAEDAVASDDAVHAAITRRYLAARGVRFVPVSAVAGLLGGAEMRPLEHRSPRNGLVLWAVEQSDRGAVVEAVAAARRAQEQWRRVALGERAELLLRMGRVLAGEAEGLALQIADEVGKPLVMARGEVARSVALLEAVAGQAGESLEGRSSAEARYRREPLGVVGIITPWNNPAAIPVGKIGPALLYGNGVVWKPAPGGPGVARRLAELWGSLWGGLVDVVTGDGAVAGLVAEEADAVTVSGAAGAGYALGEICARRHVPFQAELGGNNAAIVWEDAELGAAARQVALGAFGFAGQRCTANRRVIVADACYDAFVGELERVTGMLVWGDPLEPSTEVGPLISVAKRSAVEALLRRAREGEGACCTTIVPHRHQSDFAVLVRRGAFYPPTIVLCDDPGQEIVQEETFGPVLVVQRAKDFAEALTLCNGVRQGLVAALFSADAGRQGRFLAEVRAGVLKLNRSTVDADAVSPLGGWKASGIGPAEHGVSDREFFTRMQTIYGE